MTEKTPENQWYVRTKNGASGPYTSQQIKDFAANGKLPRRAHLSKSPDGPWTIAENAKVALLPTTSVRLRYLGTVFAIAISEH